MFTAKFSKISSISLDTRAKILQNKFILFYTEHVRAHFLGIGCVEDRRRTQFLINPFVKLSLKRVFEKTINKF